MSGGLVSWRWLLWKVGACWRRALDHFGVKHPKGLDPSSPRVQTGAVSRAVLPRLISLRLRLQDGAPLPWRRRLPSRNR